MHPAIRTSHETPVPAGAGLADMRAGDVARSEANLLRWMEYLPEDCIAMMIAMKWDVST